MGNTGIFSQHNQEGSQLARFRLSQFVRAANRRHFLCGGGATVSGGAQDLDYRRGNL